MAAQLMETIGATNERRPFIDDLPVWPRPWRRCCRLKKEGRPMPDLILIDGGKGH